MAKNTPISEVPPTFSPTGVKGLYNPYNEDFVFKFAGKEIVAPAGVATAFPEAVAAHGAKHLAKKIMMNTVNNFLLEQFPGLDEQGREKWRVNAKHYVTREDVESLTAQLLVDVSQLGQTREGVDIPEVSEEQEAQKITLPPKTKPTAKAVGEQLGLGKRKTAARVAGTTHQAPPKTKPKSKADAAAE